MDSIEHWNFIDTQTCELNHLVKHLQHLNIEKKIDFFPDLLKFIREITLLLVSQEKNQCLSSSAKSKT